MTVQDDNLVADIDTPTESDASPLSSAPPHLKLAVDLIYLLESNDLNKEIVLKALDIVIQDFKNKP